MSNDTNITELTSVPPVRVKSVVSHPALVAVAARWLQRHCSVVITELATIGETPDAIGWKGTHSFLVECKISRADFLADGQKWFRQNQWQGIGQYRYYLTTPGIIKAEELPPKWGLLELTGEKVRTLVESGHHDETNHCQEISILLSTIRRIGQQSPVGCSIKFYTIETKNNATLGVKVANEKGQP